MTLVGPVIRGQNGEEGCPIFLSRLHPQKGLFFCGPVSFAGSFLQTQKLVIIGISELLLAVLIASGVPFAIFFEDKAVRACRITA